MAQKVKNCTGEQKQLILSDDNWDKTFADEDGVVACRYKTLNIKKDLFETSINPITGRKKQSRKPIDTIDVYWIVSHSQSRAKKDNDDLNRAIEKAGKALKNKSSLKASHGYKSLIVIPKGEGTPHLDTEKIGCKIHPFSRWRTNFPREPLLKRGRGIKNADLWQSID